MSSQIDFRRETTSDFFDALVDSGLADVGTHQRGATITPDCRVLINRGAAAFGDFGSGSADKITMRLLSVDIAAPKQGDSITVTSVALGTETFVLTKLLNDDGAMTEWEVQRG